ncbi:MAG: hypothetical protein OQJ97_01000 [Rhodospirillales bacterium]|nr:hypothetical protein [Rhodospirillales bacterium]
MTKLGIPVFFSVFTLLLLLPLRTGAAELLMFDSPSCEWCEVWEEEVGVIYEKTDEGKLLPLSRYSIHDELPKNLNYLTGLRYTPTFILISNNEEIGRINGYPGEDHFWFLLNKLIGKLDKKISACPSPNLEENVKC